MNLERIFASEWWRNRAAKNPKSISAKPEPAKQIDPPPASDAAAIKRENLKRLLQLENPELLGTDKINLEKLLIIERREALRLDNEERRGRLIKTNIVAEQWLRISAQLKNRLLLVPGKLSAKVVLINDVQQVREVLDSEIREVLTVLADKRLGR